MTVEIRVDAWRDPSSLGAPRAGAAFWWLGQAGFLVEMAGQRIVIDAYLSDTLADKYRGKRLPHQRMMAPPVAPEALRGINWLLCTHGHTDHMDPGTIPGMVQANPEMRVVVPRAEQDRAVERGVPRERLLSIEAGDRMALGGVSLHATPSAHETLERDGQGNHRFLGYAVSGGGVTIWHSGDTIPFDGLVEAVRPLGVDLALLPVNGRDSERAAHGVPGNLTLPEACALADEIGAGAMVGHHLDLFDFNTLDRAEGEAWLATHNPSGHARLVQPMCRYLAF